MHIAISARGLMLVGLDTLRTPGAPVHPGHAQAAAKPDYEEWLNAVTIVQIFGLIEGFIEGSAKALADVVAERRESHRDPYRRSVRKANQASRLRGVSEDGVKALDDLGERRLYDHFFPKPTLRLDHQVCLGRSAGKSHCED